MISDSYDQKIVEGREVLYEERQLEKKMYEVIEFENM